MSTVEIKTELQQMIEHETDMSMLQAIRTILIKTGLNPILKEKLTIRALKSEEDIKAGRVFTKEEVVQRINGKS
jgi:predicted transcriptional regulator